MKAYLSVLGFLLSLVLVISANAQDIDLSTRSKKALKNYQSAEDAFKLQDYTTSIFYLKKALRHDPQFIEGWLLIGDAYRELEQNEQALEAFNKAIDIDSTFFPRVYYFTGNLYYKAGDYRQAIISFNKFISVLPSSSPLLPKVMGALSRAEFAENAMNNPLLIQPVNAGSLINSLSDDYINFINVDQTELIMTRKEPLFVDQHKRVIYTESIYKALAGDTSWIKPNTLKMSWSEGISLGGMNLSIDGRKMYFTGCNWTGGFGSCDIYVSFKEGEEWEAPSNLGPLVNSQWWDSQPFISANGKQLLFSSKRAGGKGNTDIWMSIRRKDGKWSQPINLGDSINTGGSEMAPFLHPDGKTLYFSSDGHHGLGGYDLFYSRKDETGRWSKAKNLGYPLNTKANEINMVVDLHGRGLWLSSDREGGEGATDIYQMDTYGEMRPQKVSFVKGKVLDEKSGNPIQAFVELSNLKTGMNEDSTFSDRTNGEFLMVLQPGGNYAFNISCEGYMLYSENYNLIEKTDPKPVDKLFYLSPINVGKRITLQNVYFEHDSDELNPSSFVELDKLYRLLNGNPSMKILIEGHTDSTGTDEHNLTLSEDRAKSVVNYLVGKGIDPGRLDWKGYGASMPVGSNETESGRAQNRRTEIVIL